MKRELVLHSHGQPVFSCPDTPLDKNILNAHLNAHITRSVASGCTPDVKVYYRDIPDPIVQPALPLMEIQNSTFTTEVSVNAT